MTEPLRVLCVTPSGLGGRGGIDRLYYYLRRFLAPGEMTGIDLHFVAARGESGAAWPLAFPGRLLGIAREIRAVRPHVVHINFANRGSAWRKYAVLRLSRWFRLPTVVHLHDSLPTEALARNALAARLFLAICRHADLVIALGQASAEALRSHGVAPAKVRVVLNGIPDFAADLALPKPSRGTVTILLAGRVGEHKGVGILIEALAILIRRGVGGWRCIVAGDGEVEAYSARAAGLGLCDRLTFTGWIDADAVHGLMREAGIVVLPSIAEALPLSLSEGACAGAALVATPVGNIGEIVRDGDNGLLVAREPAALADVFAALLADRDRLGRMQVASRRHYRERLTLEAFATGLFAIYRELAATAPVREPRGSPATVARPHRSA